MHCPATSRAVWRKWRKCMATQLSIWSYRGHRFAAVTRCVLPGPRTSIVRGKCVRETSVKRRNKIMQEITRNVENVFSFYAIIAMKDVFQCFNIRQVPREGLKTAASGLGFQHLPRDLANVNAWKTMFDPYFVFDMAFNIYRFLLVRRANKQTTWPFIQTRLHFERTWRKFFTLSIT